MKEGRNLESKKREKLKEDNTAFGERIIQALTEEIHKKTGKQNPLPGESSEKILEKAEKVGILKKEEGRKKENTPRIITPETPGTSSPSESLREERKKLNIRKLKEIDPKIDPKDPETYEGKIFSVSLSKVLEKKPGRPTLCLVKENIRGVVVLIEVPDGFWFKEKEEFTKDIYITNLKKVEKEDRKIYFVGDLVLFGERKRKGEKINQEDIDEEIGKIVEMMKNKDKFERKEIKPEDKDKYYQEAEDNLLK